MNETNLSRRRPRLGASSPRAWLAAVLLVGAGLAGCMKSPNRLTNIGGYGAAHSSATLAMPPGSMPAPGEELWIIRRASPNSAPAGAPTPGTGTLLAELEH